MRWAGILLLAVSNVGFVLAKSAGPKGVLTQTSKDALNILGATLMMDGVVVKFLGFYRSGVVSFVDSVFGGTVDCLSGLFLFAGV